MTSVFCVNCNESMFDRLDLEQHLEYCNPTNSKGVNQ